MADEDQDQALEREREKQLQEIKEGRTPTWERTFHHPIHGDLTFKADLPRAAALAQHSVVMDNHFAELVAPQRGGTTLLVAAIAGLQVLVTLPVVSEDRIESDDPDEPDRVRIVRVYYDPEREIDEAWLCNVWMDFSRWREGFLEALGDLKNSSGETRGSGSNESSTEPTGSPSTTPA